MDPILGHTAARPILRSRPPSMPSSAHIWILKNNRKLSATSISHRRLKQVPKTRYRLPISSMNQEWSWRAEDETCQLPSAPLYRVARWRVLARADGTKRPDHNSQSTHRDLSGCQGRRETGNRNWRGRAWFLCSRWMGTHNVTLLHGMLPQRNGGKVQSPTEWPIHILPPPERQQRRIGRTWLQDSSFMCCKPERLAGCLSDRDTPPKIRMSSSPLTASTLQKERLARAQPYLSLHHRPISTAAHNFKPLPD